MKQHSSRISFVLCIILGIITVACNRQGVYYVDSTNGNDSHNGSSPKNAWKSIEQVNNFRFKPGDKILFSGGEVYKGTIIIKSINSGNEDNPLLISSYGVGRATDFRR